MTTLEQVKARYKELSGFDAEDNPEILNKLTRLSIDVSEIYVHIEALKQCVTDAHKCTGGDTDAR